MSDKKETWMKASTVKKFALGYGILIALAVFVLIGTYRVFTQPKYAKKADVAAQVGAIHQQIDPSQKKALLAACTDARNTLAQQGQEVIKCVIAPVKDAFQKRADAARIMVDIYTADTVLRVAFELDNSVYRVAGGTLVSQRPNK